MIRKINKNDFKIISDLGNKYDDKFLNHYNLELYISSDINNIYLYEEESIIKGFIIFKKIDDFIDIELIYVDKNYQNGKIGTKLMQFIEKFDIKEINLEVSVNNVVALHLYDKLNYKVISKREKYYDGTDAIIMKKVLK